MEKWTAVLQVVAPIFAAVCIGVLARKKDMITSKEVRGMEQFVMKFGLPCLLFNSCLSAKVNAESLVSFAMVFATILMSVLFTIFVLRKKAPYHNLLMLFAAQESGMLGIPLFMTLFGAAHVFRMGVLDLAQATFGITTIAILSADAGENPTAGYVARQAMRSPLLIFCAAGLILNLTGTRDLLNDAGIMPVIISVTEFISQPVSALMLFNVGYGLSISEGNRSMILRLSAIHFVLLAGAGLVMQGILCLMPAVEPETRWAILMYTTLPGSYITASLGRTREEKEMASGVCSLLTVVSLTVFCVIAVCVA